MVEISEAFEGGNVEVVSLGEPGPIELRIRRDHQSDHLQWFYFRLSGARGRATTIRLINAGEASYLDGWQDYRACSSHDRQHWRRVATRYEDGTLVIELTPSHDMIWLAYFAPYSMERHHDLLARAQASPRVEHIRLGATLDGQDIDLLHVRLASPAATPRKRCWVIARQHPGETMAEWYVEGLLERLLDEADPIARALLDRVELWIVPNMNPDGSRRGHLRTNAIGVNLNREWREPSLERSPEVFHVRAKMLEVGLDFALDVHGDEGLPWVFIAGPSGVASLDVEVFELQARFEAAYVRHSPDFQTAQGYPADERGKADMRMASNWLADRFGKLALTLEMPFKDNADLPDPEHGWSPERSRKLGAALLGALLEVVDEL
jgi:murein tripeptide amidase MpaA